MLSYVSSSERAFKECFDLRVKEGDEEAKELVTKSFFI
jgi:hypothetical protein